MTGGTPAVGRASMVINSAGTIVYTRNFVGAANDCDVDLDEPILWQKSTDYVAGDHVRSSNNEIFFMATDSGTSGMSEPSWHATFGSSTNDGSVSWVCVGTTWAPGKAYTMGMTVTATSGSGSTRTGFTFQVQTAGSSGATRSGQRRPVARSLTTGSPGKQSPFSRQLSKLQSVATRLPHRW